MRAKKFCQCYQYEQHSRYGHQNNAALEKKEFRQYCTVILILLLCTVFYAICIHWNLFGLKDWCQRNEPVPMQQETVESEPAAYIEHIVSSGDSIWSIAERYHPDQDSRRVVWAIRKFNPMPSGERMSAKILPGQVVKVPLDVEAVEEVVEDSLENGLGNVLDAQEAREDSETDLASRQDDRASGKWLTMEATAYCACQK